MATLLNQSVQKAITLLRATAASTDGASVSALARAAGLPRATALRLIQTMEREGFVLRVLEADRVLLGPELGEPLRGFFAEVLERYVRDLGVMSFNVAFYLPPLAPTEEDWSTFPVVIQVVDRGDPANHTSDIGAMELYAAPVVSSDPFRVAHLLGARTTSSY